MTARQRPDPRSPDAVDAALTEYLYLADVAEYWSEWRANWLMPLDWSERARLDLDTDAASISLDLAVAVASEERTRKSIAW